MTINRSNYEIWFIDWIDGNLNDIQIEKLIQFLKDNPDLEEEFAEISTFRLKSPQTTFPHKNHLKKSAANVTDSQFEYLCIAHTEKDLSEEQFSELKEIIGNDPEKRRIFELFQKTKLKPKTIIYKRKNLLIRRTPGQRVLRIAFAGLSAAAVIVFAVIAFNSETNTHIIRYENIAQIQVKNKTVSAPGKTQTLRESAPSIIRSKSNLTAELKKEDTAESSNQMQKDSIPSYQLRTPVFVEKIAVTPEINVEGSEVPGYLVASHSVIIVQEYDDGQSKFSKFIAKAFREKLLREKTPKDTPLKAYEVAKAGISGLNLLLGWEMALDEKKDETGKLKSVYFSSKILKFNAPVNKVETVK